VIGGGSAAPPGILAVLSIVIPVFLHHPQAESLL